MVLPQTIDLGIFAFRIYGLIMLAAVFAAFLVSKKLASKNKLITTEVLVDVLLYVTIFGLVGARLYHVLSDLGLYTASPSLVFQIWKGGLSIFGALIGGAVGLWVFTYRKNREGDRLSYFYKLADLIVPGLAFGQAIGRLGNWFNYEALGYPTNLPWAIFVPAEFRPSAFVEYAHYHPFFLYESVWLLIVFAVLLLVYKKYSSVPGSLFFIYLFMYNSVRFFLEYLRIDSVILLGIRENQLVSLLLVIISGIGFYYVRRIRRTS